MSLQSLLGLIRLALGTFRPRRDRNGRGDLMTLEEVAIQIGTDVQVIRRAIAKGDIPAVRIGRNEIRVERAAFERALTIATAHYGASS